MNVLAVISPGLKVLFERVGIVIGLRFTLGRRIEAVCTAESSQRAIRLASLIGIIGRPAVPACGHVVRFCGAASTVLCFPAACGCRVPRHDRGGEAAILRQAARLTGRLRG